MELTEARSIFTPATGFIRRAGFDWTCNPYVGCTFGCTYCYASFLPQNRRPVGDWGRWLTAKSNAVELAARQARRLAGRAVYMSSVTDPYLPVEQRLELSRGILAAMSAYQPRIVIQTRGPLVVRDIDLLKRFAAVRVNVSIPTDSEAVRKSFEPKAPSLDRRWEALRELKSAGVPVGVCVTPTLPIADPEGFADRLARLGPAVVVVQDFHEAGGRFGADTSGEAVRLRGEWQWGPTDYRQFRDRIRRRMTVHEGEAGFFPPPAREGVTPPRLSRRAALTTLDRRA